MLNFHKHLSVSILLGVLNLAIRQQRQETILARKQENQQWREKWLSLRKRLSQLPIVI